MTRVSLTPAPSDVGIPRTTRRTVRMASSALMVRIPPDAIGLLSVYSRAFQGSWRERSGRERVHRGNGRAGFLEARLAVLRRDREPFGAHEPHVRDAEKTEQELEIRLPEFPAIARAAHPATCQRHNDLLAAGKSLRSIRRVAEGPARDRNAIDPGLELGWDREVVDRRPNHQHVSAEELLERRGIARGFKRIRLPEREVRQGFSRQVEITHLGVRVREFEARDDLARQRAARRAIAQNARIDVKDFMAHLPLPLGLGESLIHRTIVEYLV